MRSLGKERVQDSRADDDWRTIRQNNNIKTTREKGSEEIMSNYIYAGIGARRTPPEAIPDLYRVASALAYRYTLRSGGATGADAAFEKGCDSVNGEKRIIKSYEASNEAIEMARTLHPAWEYCTDSARKLLGRNCQIILGLRLDEPVDFVLCWMEPGITSGGTLLAVNCARKHNIPVFNFAEHGADVKQFLKAQRSK